MYFSHVIISVLLLYAYLFLQWVEYRNKCYESESMICNTLNTFSPPLLYAMWTSEIWFFQLLSNIWICITNAKSKTCPYSLILRVLKISPTVYFCGEDFFLFLATKSTDLSPVSSRTFAVSAQYISEPFLLPCSRPEPLWGGAVRAAAARGRRDRAQAAPLSRHATDTAPTARLCLRQDSPTTGLSAADGDCSFPRPVPDTFTLITVISVRHIVGFSQLLE